MNLTPVNIFLWVIISFFLGSLPLALWSTKLMTRRDVRAAGDGNPGAINAFKTGGWPVGVLALMLDISKAALPVGLAYQVWDWKGWEIVPVALAPIIGSAFSPFLKFRGGKSLAATLGMWIGLTLWEAPVVILASLSLAYLVQTVSGWAVVFSALSTAVFLALRGAPGPFWVIIPIQYMILFWKQREDLRKAPKFRNWNHKK